MNQMVANTHKTNVLSAVEGFMKDKGAGRRQGRQADPDPRPTPRNRGVSSSYKKGFAHRISPILQGV